MAGPVDGLRAVEIGDRGEVAGKLLADAGAEVIRVEPPQGARSRHSGPFSGDRPDVNGSLHHAYLNTNKRGVTLDVKKPQGAALWRRLLADVDIVVDSAGPGVLDGLEAGHAALEAEHERLIWCSITPFGLSGPRRDWAVTDLVSVALGGPPMSTGYDDHDLPPIRPDGEHSLNIAGEYATAGILAAVLQRERQGIGQLVDVSIHEAVAGTTEGAFANWEYLGRIVQRQTGRHAAADPTAQWQYECTDGEYICLMGGGVPRSHEIFERLLAWMDESDATDDLRDPQYVEVLYTDPRYGGEERRHVSETIGRFVQRMTAEEAYRGGQSLKLPWGRVRRPEDNLDDPHWADRDFFVEGEVAGHPRPVRYPRAPYRFTKSQAQFRRRAPLLGEHNTEVYGRELGLPASELAALAKAGVI